MSPCQEFQGQDCKASRCLQLKFLPFLLVFIITIAPISAYGKEDVVKLVSSILAVELVKKLEGRGEGWSAELGSDGCGVGRLTAPRQLRPAHQDAQPISVNVVSSNLSKSHQKANKGSDLAVLKIV